MEDKDFPPLMQSSVARVPSPASSSSSRSSKASSKHAWKKALRPHSAKTAIKPSSITSSKSPLVWLSGNPFKPGKTPLSTQMPTPMEPVNAHVKQTPLPKETTSDTMNIEDSKLSNIMAFPSLNSSPETASSVPSAHEEPLTERMITVCTNFRNHGNWLKKNFPEEITSKSVYLVHRVLRIISQRDVASYTNLSPNDWVNLLGSQNLDKYIINITDLIIIWMYTAEQTAPLPHSSYEEFRNMMVMELTNELAKVIDPKIYMPEADTKPIPSQITAPPPVPKPSPLVYSAFPSEVEKQPPPYTRHSPLVFGSGRSVQSKTKSVKSNAGKSVKSSSQNHSERKAYKPSIPNAVDSHGIPLIPPEQDDKSTYSRRSRRSQGSSKHPIDVDEEDYDDDLSHWDNIRGGKPKESPSVINERTMRAKGAKSRAKYDSLKWDGLNTTFKMFKRAIEGHLLQVGAGYITNPDFVAAYDENKLEYFEVPQVLEQI